MNFIERFLNGIKRLIYGSTTHFGVWQDSCALSGTSYVPILSKTLDYPITIAAVEFLTEKDIKAQFRIVVNGVKVFPFGEDNVVENGVNRALMPVEIADGSYLQIEVRGVESTQKNVIILNELNIIERK